MKRKHFFYLLTLLGTSLGGIQVNAQEWNNETPALLHPNEVKVDLLNSLLLLRPTVQYERLLKPDLGVGGTISVVASKSGTIEIYPTVSASAFTRWYFKGSALSQQKVGSGFCIGAIAAYNHYRLKNDDTDPRPQTNGGLGLGFELGWKYLSVSNWIGETGVSVGRNFIGTASNVVLPPVFGQYYITVGRRF